MEDKKCEECDFYLQHYVRHHSSFIKANCGHCINKKPSGRFRKAEPCEFWQAKECKPKEDASILKALENMSEKISGICAILNE